MPPGDSIENGLLPGSPAPMRLTEMIVNAFLPVFMG